MAYVNLLPGPDPYARLGSRLSEAVAEALRLGLTEPDPREDLSGADVQRKATPRLPNGQFLNDIWIHGYIICAYVCLKQSIGFCACLQI